MPDDKDTELRTQIEDQLDCTVSADQLAEIKKIMKVARRWMPRRSRFWRGRRVCRRDCRGRNLRSRLPHRQTLMTGATRK